LLSLERVNTFALQVNKLAIGRPAKLGGGNHLNFKDKIKRFASFGEVGFI
jgi:hypothetical protein